MNENLWANMYEQKKATIDGRNIWMYLISTAIGNLFVVEFETQGKELVRKIFDDDLADAERYFNYTCKKILDGKI